MTLVGSWLVRVGRELLRVFLKLGQIKASVWHGQTRLINLHKTKRDDEETRVPPKLLR